MNNFSFKVINEIKTKQRPRARVVNGKYAKIYTPKDTISYENLIKTVYQNAGGVFYGYSPLMVKIKAYFAPTAEQEKFISQGLKCVNHKDLDNIAKTILDALNGIAYKDDKQVFDLSISKEFSLTGQDYIEVSLNSHEEGSLENVKKEAYYYKIWNRREELRNKSKLTAQEAKRFKEIDKELKEAEWLPF